MRETAPRFTWRDWIPVAATLMTVGGGIMYFGGYIDRINQLERREAAIETRLQKQDDKLDAIQTTTTRTEATLEAIRGPQGGRQ